MGHGVWAVVVSLLLTGCFAAPVRPSGDLGQPGIALVEVATGLERPVYVTHAGDARLFVLEQPGRIRIIKDGRVTPAPFLDLTDRVRSAGNEQGLLGLAFHPEYSRNGRFFVHYTGTRGETVLARYQVSVAADRADPGSGQVLLTVPQPFANHNGGQLMFGPDGYLYLFLGDGGSGGDPQNNAQNLDSLLGKVLRLDVDTAPGYRVPADNPFAGKSGRGEIWALGLRNPWRASFDRATGDLYIADVGQSRIEEINFQAAASPGGANYGWRVFEGREAFGAGAKADAPAGIVFPVAQYDHNQGCSVSGGYVYRGQMNPRLTGTYLYADYCTGRIWGLRRDGGQWESTQLLQVDMMISSFGEDAAGELYVVNHKSGVYRLVAPTP